MGKDKPLKMTKAGDRLSTGKKQLELVRLEHPVVPLILRHRELTKLRTTYCDSLPKRAVLHPRAWVLSDLRIRTPSRSLGGFMGSWGRPVRIQVGSTTLRTQTSWNIPKAIDDGQRVQAGFSCTAWVSVAVIADLGQIELRDLAHLSQDVALVTTYLEGGDVPTTTQLGRYSTSPP